MHAIIRLYEPRYRYSCRSRYRYRYCLRYRYRYRYIAIKIYRIDVRSYISKFVMVCKILQFIVYCRSLGMRVQCLLLGLEIWITDHHFQCRFQVRHPSPFERIWFLQKFEFGGHVTLSHGVRTCCPSIPLSCKMSEWNGNWNAKAEASSRDLHPPTFHSPKCI